MLLKLVTKLSTYGQFGRPFMNYLESISLNNETIEYIEILKLFWDNKYDEVLETIERNISKLRKGSLYYLLLSIKLSALHRLKREQEVKEIYDELRDNFGNIPRYVRGTVVESLRNIRELYYDSMKILKLLDIGAKYMKTILLIKGLSLWLMQEEKRMKEII